MSMLYLQEMLPGKGVLGEEKQRKNNNNNSLGMRMIVRYVKVRNPGKGGTGMLACA